MDLNRQVVDRYRAEGAWLALAESVTGGLVAARLTEIPGAGDMLRGSLVTYTDDAKAALLGVDRALLRDKGAVSREVALQMAEGARRVLDATVAVSLTGFAGPAGAVHRGADGGGAPPGAAEAPSSANVPPGGEVGLVFLGVASARGSSVEERRFAGDRAAVRDAAAMRALQLALGALGGGSGAP